VDEEKNISGAYFWAPFLADFFMGLAVFVFAGGFLAAGLPTL